MTDFTYKANSLANLVAALGALQSARLVPAGGGLSNTLGSEIFTDGKGYPLFRYGVGRAAFSATMPDNSVVTIPGAGDPAMFYVAIRADVPPSDIPFDPAALGLVATSAEESEAVLGVWAS